MSVQHRKRATQGFTLTELLIVIAMMMIIAALGMPALQNLVHRTRVEGAAREVTIFLQRARMEAIKANTRAVIELDLVSDPNWMRAFIDFDGDGTFNPDLGATEARTTDFEVARQALPGRVAFRRPAGSGTDVAGFVVLPDGRVDPAGDLAIGDERENYLQVSVTRTAKATLSKWDRDTTTWLTQDEGGWTWY